MSNFKPPDDFPDLRLPDRAPERASDPVWQPYRPLETSSRQSWRAGDRVLAPWEPHFLYMGVIHRIEGSQALIEFGDGDAGWILVDQIRPLVIQSGQQLLSRRKMGAYHLPASVMEVRGNEVCILFEDSDEEEWTTLAALRIPCQPIGAAAEPTKVASHLAFSKNLKVGTRVWAPWQGGIVFAATVEQVEDEEVHVQFDDGDAGWVLREQVLPLDIPVGLPVMGRWKMGGQYYPGVVAEVQEDRVHIHYNDGDKEWTTPAALAIPLAPLGPNARATRDVNRPSWIAGWLMPIALGVLFVFMRSSCR